MTPGDLSAIAAFVQILTGISAWPIGLVIFCIILGPWIAAFFLVYLQGKRFERVVRMYEDNITLVKDYNSLANDLHDVVIMNTQAMTRLIDSIKTNQYCPEIRLRKEARGKELVI
jgi:hypothetical protein